MLKTIDLSYNYNLNLFFMKMLSSISNPIIMNSLIEKAKIKDNEATTQLFLEMQKELYAISKTRLKNEDDINDVSLV